MRVLRQIHARVLTRILPLSTFCFLLSKILSFSALSPLGNIHYARKVFAQIPSPGIYAYNSLIRGLLMAKNPNPSRQPLYLYRKMVRSGYPTPNTFTLAFVLKACSLAMAFQEGRQAKANHVTFIGILSACAHGGLVSEGRKYWSYMLESGIEPSMEHYGCMVDLLCRGGLVDEAYNFVKTIPITPNPVIWRTLLSGCKKGGMLQKAEIVAQRLLEAEPQNAENYIILAKLYGSTSQWEKMSQVRMSMKQKGIRAVPGCTSIEVDGFMHEFVMGDWSHPEAMEIRRTLRDVSVRIQKSGHEPLISAVLHRVDAEEKEHALYEHSERLAIAYGLLKVKAPAAIRIVKNLRVCQDCHEVTKIISKIYGREIIVRDRVRFHKFVNGSCSCRDYW
ncbi:hypothetical protein Tsubulata_046047 [Turnera subulata]|uniref:DYW domain-containing protein n=1 Tax=Turnera subulata TaxID=218843 RepID=A0A9Q0IXZ0_9ROSI|nr:hypothetical protein Tsubulata_046047 [Turnera subulata]